MMGKKVARRANTVSLDEHRRPAATPEPAGWDPIDGIDERRERRYERKVRPQSANQGRLIEAIDSNALTIAVGPAGTGKTYLAVTAAVEALERGTVARVLLTRPAVEAGESLGFLPGPLEDKLAPYLRPLYDALGDRLGGKRLRALLGDGTIEIAPVAYMRGRTLNNAFVVIDEAQNCTYGQIKMLLTRLGWHSTMVVTGDPDQTDLLPELSGLDEVARRIEGLDGVAIVRLTRDDVVRHPLVGAMLQVL
jgi:phosphate starvation-inducible protein PhoH and related proteins